MGSQLGSAGLMLVNSLINIYLFLLMLRFLLQASRADYYNPLSQSVVKITQSVVGLFQGFLGPVGGRFDLATLAAAGRQVPERQGLAFVTVAAMVLEINLVAIGVE